MTFDLFTRHPGGCRRFRKRQLHGMLALSVGELLQTGSRSKRLDSEREKGAGKSSSWLTVMASRRDCDRRKNDGVERARCLRIFQTRGSTAAVRLSCAQLRVGPAMPAFHYLYSTMTGQRRTLQRKIRLNITPLVFARRRPALQALTVRQLCKRTL